MLTDVRLNVFESLGFGVFKQIMLHSQTYDPSEQLNIKGFEIGSLNADYQNSRKQANLDGTMG